MNDRSYSYQQGGSGYSHPAQAGVRTFRPPPVRPLSTPGMLAPLRAPHALSVHVAPQGPANADAAAPPYAPPTQGFAQPPGAGAQMGSLPPMAVEPMAAAPIPATPMPPGYGPPVHSPQPPAYATGPISPYGMGATPMPHAAHVPLPMGGMATPMPHAAHVPLPMGGMATPMMVPVVSPAAMQALAGAPVDAAVHAYDPRAHAPPQETALPEGPGASPWATEHRMQPAALPSAHVIASAKPEEPLRSAPAAPARPPSSSKAPIVVVALLFVAAAGAVGYMVTRHRSSSSDPISVGVNEDGSPKFTSPEEPSASPAAATAAGTNTAARRRPAGPGAPRPKAAPRGEDDNKKDARPPPPPPAAGEPKYHPTEL